MLQIPFEPSPLVKSSDSIFGFEREFPFLRRLLVKMCDDGHYPTFALYRKLGAATRRCVVSVYFAHFTLSVVSVFHVFDMFILSVLLI